MDSRAKQVVIAGALLAATATVGAVARGTSRVPANPERPTFTAAAGGPISFSGTLDRRAVMQGRDGVARIELSIAAAPGDAARGIRRPTDVAVILDRSGSMSGEKIEHARAAVNELLAQLAAQDRFALITYSDDAVLTVPLAPVDENARGSLRSTVNGIEPMGGTNMASGLDLALNLIDRSRSEGRVPHVILISDGLANQGDSSPEGLTRRANRAARGEYMLSTVGVGADFNEYLMTSMADAGTGNYYYVSDPRLLSDVFAREFDAARTTVASGLAVEIEPGPGVRVVDAAGYPLETSGDKVVFHPGSLFAGQDRRVWVTLAVPQGAVGEYDLGKFSVSYGNGRDRSTLSLADRPRIACVASDDEFYAGIDRDAWTRSVTVDAYNKMQEEVAREVKAGRRDEALQRVQDFRANVAPMNDLVRSAPVAKQIGEADKLESRVRGAFVGLGQAERQNELSKEASALSVDGRRAGSKK